VQLNTDTFQRRSRISLCWPASQSTDELRSVEIGVTQVDTDQHSEMTIWSEHKW